MFNRDNIFTKYPDIVTAKELSKMLDISLNTAYALLRNNEIYSFKIGTNYKIPKESVIDFVNIQECITDD